MEKVCMKNIPETMRVMLITDEQTLEWGSVKTPTPKDTELLVKVEYAAINRADVLQRHGDYPPPPGWPEWCGLEVSGTVAAMGEEAAEKSGYKIGDKVCALLGGGGYAEYTTVEYGMTMPVPKNITMAEAAGIPEVYATAYLNLFREGNLKKGETVCVFAGASGVGIAVTQIAKAFGCRVIATVRSDEKKEYISRFGADIILNSKKESIADTFEANPADVVIDCVGGADMGACFEKMNRGGRWIMIATLGGSKTEIDLKTVYKKGLRIIGSTLRSRTNEVKAQILSELSEKIFPYFENGSMKPEIYKLLPMDEANEGHAILERNENIGKVILKVSD